MAIPYKWGVILAMALIFSAGCSTNDGEKPGDPDGSILLDKGATPDNKVDPPPTSYKVAAVQYGKGDYSKQTQSCSDDLCGLSAYIRTAAKNKAKLVVIPEYSTGQKAYETSPKIGDKPATDSRWTSGSIIKTFAKLAGELEITLVFNLITEDGSERYNTNLALDREGKVVARHYKFQLFGGEKYTPGPSVNTSFFDTPAGRAGMLICADAQCVVTGLQTSTDCSAHAVTQLQTFFGKKPDLVVFSALWTVGPSNPNWYSVSVQSQIATGAKVWVVGANTTTGAGYGGGIFDPTGKEVAVHKQPSPAIMYAEIPFKK